MPANGSDLQMKPIWNIEFGFTNANGEKKNGSITLQEFVESMVQPAVLIVRVSIETLAIRVIKTHIDEPVTLKLVTHLLRIEYKQATTRV